ncbi:MAG: ATP-binding protein, partial [Acidobacteriota bacterium]
ASRLTPIGFRRDIKLFLAALVGFLVVIILTLLLLLQSMTATAIEQTRARWTGASDVVADSLHSLPATSGHEVIESQLDYLRGRYGVAAVILNADSRKPIASGVVGSNAGLEQMTRETQFGRALLYFDASYITSIERTFNLTAGICVLAALGAMLLLVLYLPRIIRPIEELLDQAATISHRDDHTDEAGYIIQTFKTSIARLKEQETELKLLHAAEKNRADDLQRVTATLTRSLSSGFIAIDAAGCLVDMNNAAREILRLPDGPVAGQAVAEVLGTSPITGELLFTLDKRSMVSRKELEYRAGEETIPIGITTVPLVNDTGQILGVIALFADLTQIKQLEGRVREMQALADLGEISAGIAHEFRNSLTTILGYLKLARRGDLDAPSDTRVANAEHEAVELSKVVEALLNFARPMSPKFERVDLAEVVRGVISRMREVDTTPKIREHLSETIVSGDPVLLSRTVENLIRNAIDAVASVESGEVRITCDPEPKPILVVKDNGVGLEPESISRLFLPFQTGKASGMGLGLPLARKIALLHGASLTLAGTVGGGATATLAFDSPERSM